MRILQVNKFLYRRAGAEAYMLDLAELLVSRGHEVMLWGMRDRFQVSGFRFQVFKDLLLEPINYDKREGLVKDFSKLGHMIWSLEAAKKFEEVLKKFKPDIIHIHNIYHHISPSILAVARRYKVPVVQTLHDFKLICPNYKLFTKGAVCQRCKCYKYWNAVRYKCLQGSCVASAAAALEMWAHRALQIYEKDVAKFITPSNFLRELLIEWGKDKKKIAHLPNFMKIPLNPPFRKGEVENPPQSPFSKGGGSVLSLSQRESQRGIYQKGEPERDFILFAGRLAEEKGIWLLLEIAKALPEIKFKVAGTGPEEKGFRFQVSGFRLKNVEVLGFQEKAAMQKLIANARLIIVPSLWYENYPMSVLEAQAMGKAVIASAIGGIPEMIEDGKTGFLVDLQNYKNTTKITKLGNLAVPHLKSDVSVGLRTVASEIKGGAGGVIDWIAKIKQIYYDDVLLQRVGQAGRDYIIHINNPEEHYHHLMDSYREVIAEIH